MDFAILLLVKGNNEWYNRNTMRLAIDSYGNLSVIKYYKNSTDYYTCYAMTNVFGDVVSLHNSSGTMVVSYEYDAWGNVISMTDTTTLGIGTINPIRYRGYYFDEETGLYYLASRYYDPETGRFINADIIDTITATPAGLTDKNLYSYCDNNPVTRIDDGGQFWNVVIGAVVGGAVNLVSSIVTEKIKDKLEWEDVGKIAASTIIGMAEGAAIALCPAASAAISAVASAADTAITGILENESVETVVINTIVSGAIGAVAGSGGSDFVKGGKLINDAAGSVGNAIRKGVHPAVKRAARKTIKKAGKYIGRAYVSGQIENMAYGGIYEFSALYTRTVFRINRARGTTV